ncbi:3-dehydroquinate dehydratase [bacterium]|nr:3-dehydroquinate dehydratase [bacterium]MBP9807908.1 3-dehydroquinate dehydratase [bacterium]
MKILVLNGPNLNLLGARETSTYGQTSLAEIESRLVKLAKEISSDSTGKGEWANLELEFKQSNVEGELVNIIQSCMRSRSVVDTDAEMSGVLINPGAYGHTSIAIRDAFLAVALPFVEVHVSNVYAREPFRHKSYLSDVAVGVIAGFGANSYELGLRALYDHLIVNAVK